MPSSVIAINYKCGMSHQEKVSDQGLGIKVVYHTHTLVHRKSASEEKGLCAFLFWFNFSVHKTSFCLISILSNTQINKPSNKKKH